MSLVVMVTMLVLGSYLFPLPKVRVQQEHRGQEEPPLRMRTALQSAVIVTFVLITTAK